MLVSLSNQVGGYLYAVFVESWNGWIILGFFGQALFTMRFLVQWIASEKAQKSVIPLSFWFFSIGGGALLLVYAIYKGDPVFIVGQGLGVFIYVRNLWLIKNEKKAENVDKS
jgi:lipid-A-disaccharide synthase-like uncharacterized protein